MEDGNKIDEQIYSLMNDVEKFLLLASACVYAMLISFVILIGANIYYEHEHFDTPGIDQQTKLVKEAQSNLVETKALVDKLESK